MARAYRTDPAVRRTEPPVRLSRLWFGLAAAPLAWAVAELVGYVLAARDCGRWRTGLAAYAVPNAPVVVVAISLAMAALAAAGLAVALLNLRVIESGAAPSDERARVEWSRARFMSFAGIIMSALLLLNIVFFALPPFLVNACSQVR
jgi:hypothetical protein